MKYFELVNDHCTNIAQTLEQMHQIEHSAAGKKHERKAALTKAFVTPVDREVFFIPWWGIRKKADSCGIIIDF